MCEILLVRVFAIEHFHHFAYMAIGVAMLGFGLSGTLVALGGLRDPARAERWFGGVAAATPIALVLGPAAAHLVNLDATRLAWDGGEWARLALVYAALALPFTVGSGAILLAFLTDPHPLTPSPSRERGNAGLGRLYGASFAGAGLGAVAALVVLWGLSPTRALATPAVVGALGALVARRSAATWAGLAIAAIALARPPWRLEITPYKGLPQVEAYPDARRLTAQPSPVGWVVAVRAPAFRHAPGLSLAYSGRFPEQTALFVDGDLAGAAWASEDTAAAVLDWLPTTLPYALGSPGRVLIVGAGGGTEVHNALAHGAGHVVAVELHPALARLAGTPTDAPVVWVVGDARSYLAGTRERFDLIMLGPGGAFSGAAAGVHSLNEDFLHTIDAYAAYLRRLSPNGVLAVTRWLDLPPRSPVRAVLTAGEALRRVTQTGAVVERGLVVARSWATVTVLAKPAGFGAPEIAALRGWAEQRRFDLDWYPGITAGAPPPFNALDDSVLFEAARASATSPAAAERFAAGYPFAVVPVGDARPYPHHFLRPGAIGRFLATSRGTWLPFAEWGYVALLATLVQSGVLAALLLVVPVAATARRSGITGTPRLVGYFASVGLAYVAAEVAAIQQLALLLGHPVYAVAGVLAALLVCSGFGSVRSDRLPAGRCAARAALIAGLLALYGIALLPLVHSLQSAGFTIRLVVGLVAVAPAGVLMGVPFPLGLRALGAEGGVGGGPRLAWAWAANGFASVVGVPLAALVALEAGSPALFFVATLAYLAAAALAWRVDTRAWGTLIQS